MNYIISIVVIAIIAYCIILRENKKSIKREEAIKRRVTLNYDKGFSEDRYFPAYHTMDAPYLYLHELKTKDDMQFILKIIKKEKSWFFECYEIFRPEIATHNGRIAKLEQLIDDLDREEVKEKALEIKRMACRLGEAK